MHKKRPKICLYHSTKIDKAGPGFDDQLEHPPVQINFSSPCSNLDVFIRTFVATLELLFSPQNGLLRDILCKYVNPLDATLKLMQKASFNPM